MADIIKDIRLGSRKVKIFALGDKVIWERPPEPKLKGKFTDDSTASDWWYKPNTRLSKAVDISEFVDSTTKEFAIYDINDTPFFNGNTKIERIDVVGNYGNVSDLNRMFENCNALTMVNLSELDMSQSKSLYWAFNGCSSLTNVIGPISGISTDVNLLGVPLTNESAMVFINGLAQVSSVRHLMLKTSTYNTLTPEQIAIATSKGWDVSTDGGGGAL